MFSRAHSHNPGKKAHPVKHCRSNSDTAKDDRHTGADEDTAAAVLYLRSLQLLGIDGFMRAAVVRIVRCQQQHMFLQPASCTRRLLQGRSSHSCPPLIYLHVAPKPGCLTALTSSNGSTSTSNNRIQSRTAHSKSKPPSAKASHDDGSVDDDEADDSRPGKPLRVERLLANLGYGKRKECTVMIKRQQLVYAATGQPAKVRQA